MGCIMMTPTIAPEHSFKPFTAKDRCDGCVGAAKYLMLLPSGKHLQLCGHHGDQAKKSYL